MPKIILAKLRQCRHIASMTTTKYFSDMNGETVEIEWPQPMKNSDFTARFPGVKGVRYDSFAMLVGDKGTRPVTRRISYKCRPSLHVCNARCRGGKCGGVCECQCGGKNHGVNS